MMLIIVLALDEERSPTEVANDIGYFSRLNCYELGSEVAVGKANAVTGCRYGEHRRNAEVSTFTVSSVHSPRSALYHLQA